MSEKLINDRRTLWVPDGELDGAKLGNEENTYLGYAIDVLHAEAPQSSQLLGSVFKDDVYDSTRFIDVSTLEEANTVSLESNSFIETFTNLDIDAGIKTGSSIPFFSGGLEAKYGKSRKLSSTAKFYTATISVSSKMHTIKSAHRSDEKFKNLIEPAVIDDINNPDKSPSALFRDYGTHIIRAASIGGCIQVSATYRGSESIENESLKAALDLSCAYVSTKITTELSKEQKKILSSTEIRTKCEGGDASQLVGMIDYADMPKVLSKWGASLSDPKRHVLCKIFTYVPIWNFATGDRRGKIEKYFLDTAKQLEVKVAGYITKEAPIAYKLVALKCKAFMPNSSIAEGNLAYIDVDLHPLTRLAEAHKKANSLASIITQPPIEQKNRIMMITNPDNTYSFKFTKKVGDTQREFYLSVHYNSTDEGKKYGDVKQLFINAETVGDREKFTLEYVKGSSDRFNIKSVFTGQLVYQRSSNNHLQYTSLVADKSHASSPIPVEFTMIPLA